MEASEKYKQSYLLALLYVSDELIEDMNSIDVALKENKLSAQQKLEELIPKIEKYIGKLK